MVSRTWTACGPRRSSSAATTRERCWSPTAGTASTLSSRTTTIQLKDEVVLRIDRYDDTERGRRLLGVALCNDQETPRKISVEAWLYQTKISVDAGGEAVFLPVTDLMEDVRPERDDELRRLRLQYRDRLEFAIGRTCSVDWSVAEGSRRANAVWTTWLPTTRTPQLGKWVRQDEIDAGARPGTTTEESAQLKAMKKEIAELKRANEILKTAASFFAAELDRPHTRS